MLPSFTYVRAESVQDAVGHLSSAGAMVHAGGTDLLGCLRDDVFRVEKLVSISRIDDLRGILRTADGGLRIGALTTITEIAENPIVRDLYPALADAAAEVASPQLRNQGTLGGNICQKPRCWYYRGEFHCLRKGGDLCFAVAGQNQFHCILGGDMCYIVHPSDTAPALIAHEAAAKIVGPGGVRSVPIEEFHVPPSQDVQRETILEPGELVVEIVLPPPPRGLRSSYRKVRARRAWDFALAGVALAIQFSNDRVSAARVVFSGVAPVPWRSREVEQAVVGKRLDADAARRAADAAVQGTVALEHNGYKIPLLRGVVEEELLAIARP